MIIENVPEDMRGLYETCPVFRQVVRYSENSGLGYVETLHQLVRSYSSALSDTQTKLINEMSTNTIPQIIQGTTGLFENTAMPIKTP